MDLHRFTRQLAICAALSALVAPAAAEDVIRIGVLSDMSGPYSDIAGKGSVAAAQLAVGGSSKQARSRVGNRPKVVRQ